LERKYPVGSRIPLFPVSFAEEMGDFAEAVLFWAYDGMETSVDEKVFLVLPRTKRLLEDLGVVNQDFPVGSFEYDL
jgi:hypothetical protein